MRNALLLFAAAIGAAVSQPHVLHAQATPPVAPLYWQTTAERSDYHRTADYGSTIRFARQLQEVSGNLDVQMFGVSGQGRPMPLLVVSTDRAFTPAAARATGKPVVFVLCGIHAGEISGKDATLALLRDALILDWEPQILKKVTLLVVPMFSVDAHERTSPYNRINQNGPDAMGWRYTPIGLNLNRDFMKAEAPEMRAMLGQVFARWRPDLLIDTHTTDGDDYRHDLTYDYGRGPVVPHAVEQWAREVFEGRIVPRFAAMGHLPSPYLGFRTPHHPEEGVDADAFLPRFSHEYAALQCRPGILLETHMLKPYRDRVKAVRDMLYAVIDEVGRDPAALESAVSTAEAEVRERVTSRDPAARRIALTTKLGERVDTLAFKGVRETWSQSSIAGGPVPTFTKDPIDMDIPFRRETLPDLVITEPAGYLLPREWADVRAVLDVHGIRYRRFAATWTDTVEAQHVDAWWARSKPYEGHFAITVTRVANERRQRTYEPGDLWIPLDQPSALVAIHLLEAQAPDGLTYWNAFDTVLEPKEYAEDYVMAPIAEKMMADDPALAREFRARVAADSSFANDPRARVDFFYRRSKWADPEFEVLPPARALRPPPESVLAKAP